MMNLLNLHRVIKGVETLGNIPESPCEGVCTIVRERISKYIEGMKEIILKKFP
jgi:hypothetical protein